MLYVQYTYIRPYIVYCTHTVQGRIQDFAQHEAPEKFIPPFASQIFGRFNFFQYLA